MKKGDIVTLKKITPDFIKDNCPKKMIITCQGANKNFFNCNTLDGLEWCGSLHISYLKKIVKTQKK